MILSGRRIAAVGALVIGLAALVLALIVAVQEFPQGLVVLGLVCIAGVVAWYGVRRRGVVRAIGLSVGAIAFAAAILLLLDERVVEVALIVGGLVAAGSLAMPLSGGAHLSPVPAPEHPVLIFNPKSGGGKAERFSLATEARARGIEPIELTPGEDLEQIVRDAVAGGRRARDGRRRRLPGDRRRDRGGARPPYACVPAGTRNHFALDLGVDRDDVVGALDAFVDGGERRVDLGEVNGRVFVNNVSLGVYAEAVQRSGYRDASSARCSTRCRTRLGPRARASICAGRVRTDRSTAPVP